MRPEPSARCLSASGSPSMDGLRAMRRRYGRQVPTAASRIGSTSRSLARAPPPPPPPPRGGGERKKTPPPGGGGGGGGAAPPGGAPPPSPGGAAAPATPCATSPRALQIAW